MLYFIYRLKDPRNPDDILCSRYIGRTSNPNLRMMQHLLCDGHNQDKDAWIKELSNLRLEPFFEIIEVIYEGKAYTREREKYWIQYYLDQGCQLTNIRLIKRVTAEANQTFDEPAFHEPANEESRLTDKPLSLDEGFARYAKVIQGIYKISQPTKRELKIMLNFYFGTASYGKWEMGEEEWYQNKLVELEITEKLELPNVELFNRDLALLATLPEIDPAKRPSNSGRPSPLRWG